MRILHVIPGRDEPGNASMVYARRQIDALRQHGDEHFRHYLALRMTPLGVLRGWRRLRDEIARIEPDLIHSHFGTITALLCVLAGPRVIISFRGSDINADPSVPRLRSALQKLFSRCAARRAAGAIFVSKQLANALPVACPAIVMPDGIDINRFSPMDRQEARARLGWPAEQLTVLWNGGRPPQKNKRPDLAYGAVNAAALRSGKFIWPHFLSGDTDANLMPLLINASDCILMTSDFEGSPNITKEALCCGVPVVSVDVGDAREQLAGVDNCAIADHDPTALGAAILQVIGKTSNGRHKVLSCEQAADRLNRFYRHVEALASENKTQNRHSERNSERVRNRSS